MPSSWRQPCFEGAATQLGLDPAASLVGILGGKDPQLLRPQLLTGEAGRMDQQLANGPTLALSSLAVEPFVLRACSVPRGGMWDSSHLLWLRGSSHRKGATDAPAHRGHGDAVGMQAVAVPPLTSPGCLTCDVTKDPDSPQVPEGVAGDTSCEWSRAGEGQ